MQRRWASEVLGYPVWGLSPAVAPGPDGYREYGVTALGTSKSYAEAAVTPHAVALALAVAPEAATATLRELASRYEVYGEYGFYDSVDPKTRRGRARPTSRSTRACCSSRSPTT